MKQLFRTVLVIGNNPDEAIKKYSENTMVEKHLYLRKCDAGKKKQEKLLLYEQVLEDGSFLNEEQKEAAKHVIESMRNRTDEEFFYLMTEGCTYDKETGDAYTERNTSAYYRNERSPQKTLEETGEETGFCNPFKLKDGSISYSAKKGDIDWPLNHLANQQIYKDAWELVIEDREPRTRTEGRIKKNMANRTSYFNNFATMEEYVLHSTSFWTYGVVNEDGYNEVGMDGNSDKEWVKTFYDKYVKGLPDDTLLTIYEVQGVY